VHEQLQSTYKNLRRIGIPMATWACISGIGSGDVLSLYLSGRRDCPRQRLEMLATGAAKLERLSQYLHPLRIRWAEAGYIQDLITRIYEDRSLEIRITDHSSGAVRSGLDALSSKQHETEANQ
jgi:hypothetical protein